jgi:hypothetical protein
MRSKCVLVATLFGVLLSGIDRAEAATIQVTLNPIGFREIEIPITTPPGEFDALTSSWGSVTLSGALVGYYVFSTEDKQHTGSLAPTVYPNPWYTIVVRITGSPTELLVLEGSRQPLNEGGGTFGGVTVATGALAILRGATFTTAATGSGVVLTLIY